MDELNENCVLVTGYLLKGDGKSEPHMWNAVKNGGDWYAVDVTGNDSSRYFSSTDWSNGDYLMITGDILEADHIFEPKISSASYEMPYPKLVYVSRQFERGIISADYAMYDGSRYPSCKGVPIVIITMPCTLAELEAQGYYPAYGDVYNGSTTWMAFSYLIASVDGSTSPACWTENNKIYYNVGGAQSAPTYKLGLFDIYNDVKNSFTPSHSNPDIVAKLSYVRYSDSAVKTHLLEEQTYNNPTYNPTYVAPALLDLSQTTPYRLCMEMRDIKNPIDVKIVYTQKLVKVDPSKPVELSVYAESIMKSVTHEDIMQVTKIENFAWDGNKTFTFKITPSRYFQHNKVLYHFSFTNVVNDISLMEDAESKKALPPTSFGILIGYLDEFVCSKCSPDGKLKINTYGAPVLTSTSDLSLKNWTYETDELDENGNPIKKQVSENQRSQLALVVTKPTADIQEQVSDAFNRSINADSNIEQGAVMQSATYEIDLTLCGKYVNIANGAHVTVNFGFPEGITADSEGVTFKVYHFKRLADGSLDYDNPEILDCIVTKYGITVYMDSFSPFVLVAFDSTKVSESTTKGIIVDYNSDGGSVQGLNLGTTATLVAEGESAVYNIVAKEGYEVEYVMLNGNLLTFNNKESMSFTFSYEILASNNVLSVGFVAKSVKTLEESNGLTNMVIENAVSSAPVQVEIEAEELPTASGVVEINYVEGTGTVNSNNNTNNETNKINETLILKIAIIIASVLALTAILVLLNIKKHSHRKNK